MPIAEAFKGGRGKAIDQFTRHGGKTTDAVRFAVELFLYGDYPPPPRRSKNGKDHHQSRFRYELTIERRRLPSGAERLVARDERLSVMRREDDSWMVRHPELAACAGYRNGGDFLFVTLKNNSASAQEVVGLPTHWPEKVRTAPTHTALTAANYGVAHLVRENLQLLRILGPATAELGEASERLDSGELNPSVSNLPSVLAELPPNVLGEIRADLVSLVPGKASFEVTPERDEIRLDFELSGGDSLPARLVSAGTLRILALLTAIRAKPRAHMLCVEEPENGIYPGRMRAVLELFKEVTGRSHEGDAQSALEEARSYKAQSVWTNQLPTQILLTSHSPVALATFRSRPEHVRFVDMVRRNGERVTRVRTIRKGAVDDGGRSTISTREIDLLLDASGAVEPDE